MPRDLSPITPETLLLAYAAGVFPMADGRDDPEVFWVDPRDRGVLPLDGFRMSRSLSRAVGRDRFLITLNDDFDGVLAGCAAREETWINHEIAALYRTLHRSGFAHSLEVWADRGQRLVGGVYGVTIGSAFFGESMFSTARDASKIALAYLVTLLRREGFTLFDTQFLTDHLASLGAIEIPREAYRAQLATALGQQGGARGAGTSAVGGPASEEPDVVATMLQRVERGGGGDHPAGEELPDLSRVDDLDQAECIAAGVVQRVATLVQRHLQCPVGHRLTGHHFHVDHVARNLVERAQDGPVRGSRAHRASRRSGIDPDLRPRRSGEQQHKGGCEADHSGVQAS